ncbi:MAG: hypothetical protein AAF542_19320 [Pseudomonadota bacterium]
MDKFTEPLQFAPNQMAIRGTFVISGSTGTVSEPTPFTEEQIKQNMVDWPTKICDQVMLSVKTDANRIANFQNAIGRYTTANKLRLYILDIGVPLLAFLLSILFIAQKIVVA